MNLPKGILFLMFSLFFADLFAQNSVSSPVLEKEAITVVYFGTDKHDLGLSAREIISDFIINKNLPIPFELRLKGFTDDIGNRSSNEVLALNRAMEVKKYLETLGVSTKNIKILDCEELILNNNQNLVEQRRKNRRVELEYWTTAYRAISSTELDNQELDAFFVNNRAASQQQFSFEASKDAIITGAQGTVLRIPSNCFVDSKGNPAVGTISLVLQEVYSYKDMILQNLATTSNDKQLETGGMLYLEAKNVSGNLLQLRAGATIDAAMASEASKLPKMQTFEGVNHENATGNAVNWIPTGQLVSNSNSNRQRGETSGGVIYRSELDFVSYGKGDTAFYQKSTLKDLQKSVSELYISRQEMPRKAIAKPNLKIRAPKYPNLKRLKSVNKDDLKIKYPKSTTEKNVAYNSRIRSKYIKLKNVYRKGNLRNRKRIRSYKRDSSRYVKNVDKHQDALTAYADYHETMKQVSVDLYKSTEKCDFREQKTLYSAVNTLTNTLASRNKSIKTLRLDLIKKLKALDTIGVDLLANLENYNPKFLTKKEGTDLKNIWADKDINKLIRKFYKTPSRRSNLLSYEKKFRRSAGTVKRTHKRIEVKEHLSSYDLAQIRKQKTEISRAYNYKVLNDINATAQQALNKMEPILNKFTLLEDSILTYRDAYAALRVKYNLPLEDDQSAVGMDYTTNSDGQGVLTLKNMGWINCDRFYNTPQEMLAKIMIETKSSNNTHFYVIFKGINSVMHAIPTGDSFTNASFVVNNVPADAWVKIVGLKKSEKQFELFLKDGMIGELSQVNATFEKKTEKELNLILANL
jgi:hypothetical protein